MATKQQRLFQGVHNISLNNNPPLTPYLTDARECILCSDDDWSNDAHDACVPKIIEFLAFGEPLGITLIVISAFGALVTIAVGVRLTRGKLFLLVESEELKTQMLYFLLIPQVVFIVNLGTPLVKANDALLSFSLLFALVVTFLCSIIFLGEPQNWSCMTSQVALALGFALCLSSIMGGPTFLALSCAYVCIYTVHLVWSSVVYTYICYCAISHTFCGTYFTLFYSNIKFMQCYDILMCLSFR